MDFNQVRYFLALKDSLNFTRAAERCGVSQPALTQAIRRLESELGGQLVRRNGGHSEMTELGEAVYDQFRQLETTRQLVEATARSVVAGDEATLNIGVMCTLSHEKIAPMLAKFRTLYPKVTLVLHDLELGQLTEMIITGGVDGAFCANANKVVGRVNYLPLFVEKMVVAFQKGHRFEALEDVPMEDLMNENYLDRLRCEFRSQFFDDMKARAFDVQIAASSGREDWIQGLLAQGMGVTVVPEFMFLGPNISVRPIVGEPGREVEFATLKSTSLSRALHSFVEVMKEYRWG